MRKLLLLFAVIAAGCAQKPEAIQASYVSPAQYSGWSCPQLAEEAPRVDAALSQAEQQQRKARTGDTVGVLLLGMPTSSMSGEAVGPEVARLKGTRVAIQQAMIRNNCSQG